jgi:nucleoid DNA-binding protein
MAKAAAKAAPKKKMTKSGFLTHLAEASGHKKTEVAALYDLLVDTITKELKKSGEFTLPGVAKLKLKKVAAIKGGEKKVMRATGKEYVTKSKPAHNKIRAIPVKAFKDSLA